MTNAQIKAVEKIREMAKQTIRNDVYEFKQFEINENENSVSVVVVIGRKNDEGTITERFDRARAKFSIGPKGGITYPVHKGNTIVHKRFTKYDSFLLVVCVQKFTQI